MRPTVVLGVVLTCLLAAAPLAAEDFSFFGVRFGMLRAEVDKLWVKTGDNGYAIANSAVNAITTAFDLDKRLYEISFTLNLNFPGDPPPLVATALQRSFEERWARDPNLAVSVMSARNQATITVVDKKLRDGYIRRLEEKILSLVRP